MLCSAAKAGRSDIIHTGKSLKESVVLAALDEVSLDLVKLRPEPVRGAFGVYLPKSPRFTHAAESKITARPDSNLQAYQSGVRVSI